MTGVFYISPEIEARLQTLLNLAIRARRTAHMYERNPDKRAHTRTHISHIDVYGAIFGVYKARIFNQSGSYPGEIVRRSADHVSRIEFGLRAPLISPSRLSPFPGVST